jgi:hypothetical protein
MSHIGIVNLAERLLNQAQAEEHATPNLPSPPQRTSSASTSPNSASASSPSTSDEFTASTPTTASDASAQAAGLFSVRTLSLFTAAANFILGTNTTTANAGKSAPPAAAPATPTAATPSATTTPAAATLAAATIATAPAVATTPAPVPPPAPAANTDTTTAAPPAETVASTFIPPPTLTQVADTNSQLQSLNDSLAALGLSQSDITVIDRVASAFQDYNPTTYTDLVYQLEGLAQTQSSPLPAAPGSGQITSQITPSATQTPAPAATNPSIAVAVNPGNTAGAVPKAGSAGIGALKLQGLVIQLATNTATPPTTATTSPATSSATPQNPHPALTLPIRSEPARAAAAQSLISSAKAAGA